MRTILAAASPDPGEIPASVHYREADDPSTSCATCTFFNAGICSMWNADVSPSYVCDKWQAVESDHAGVSADHHNAVLQAAYRRVQELEARLALVLQPILHKAGLEAARAFQSRATDHLTAGGDLARELEEFFARPIWDDASMPVLRVSVPEGKRLSDLVASADITPRSTMVAVFPRPDEQQAIAEDGGEDPAIIHCTLAFLGELTPDQTDAITAALGTVAASHAPLEGNVGGVGAFNDMGNGVPAIALPDVPGLVELRHAVCEAIIGAGQDYSRQHGYTPHMTVAYRGPGEDHPPDRATLGQPVHFDDLHVVQGDERIAAHPLTGPKPLTASGEPPTIEEDIARVAEEYAPEGGYGDTWWSESTSTVFWCSADWSTDEECEAAEDAFLAIDGVESVRYDAEVGQPDTEDGSDEWVKIWPTKLTAAADDAATPPPPDWTSPAPDELLDVQALVQTLRTKTDPIRLALLKTVMTPALVAAGIDFDVSNPLTAKVIAQAGSQIVGIAKTTQLNVMHVISESYKQGLSIPDTATAIKAGMREASMTRATTIARTELAGAVNGGSLASTQIVAEATGTAYFKEWMTAPGALTPRHEDYDGLDGQTVGLEEFFDVGGDNLQYPGDPDGDPGETINCRCTMSYTDRAGDVTEEVDDGGEGTAPDMGAIGDEGAVDEGDAGLEAAPEAESVPGDTISVGEGPPVSPAALEKISDLNLNQWPQQMGVAGRSVFGKANNTEELYRHNGEWSQSRKALHDQIIDAHFDGKVPGESKTAYYTAGGGASGKSAALFNVGGKNAGLDDLAGRKDVIAIDPDRIKTMLPEYMKLLDAGDPSAAAAVHEESSALAKAIVKRAQDQGYSVLVDTTGSSSTFVDKLEASAAKGYDVKVTMFSTPTNEAITRSVSRGDRSGRYIAIQPLKTAHKGASTELDKWRSSKGIGEWRVYDNSSAPPKLVAEGGGGKETIYDPVLWKAILAKKDE